MKRWECGLTVSLTHFLRSRLHGMEGIGADRRAGSRPCGLSLSGCRRISGRTRKTSGKYPALRAGCFPSASPVLPAARNKGIGSDRRAGSRPCGLSLSGCRRISGRTRKTSGKYPALRAGCFPSASPVLPAARNKGIGSDRRAGSRPCGLSLSGCRRISGKTGKTSGKYPALRAGCFPAASPILPAARLVALEKSCH